MVPFLKSSAGQRDKKLSQWDKGSQAVSMGLGIGNTEPPPDDITRA